MRMKFPWSRSDPTAIGALDQRLVILVDTEKLMSTAEMGLVEQVLQQTLRP